MKRQVNKRAILIFLFLMVAIIIVAGTTQASTSVNENKWQQLVNDKDFGYKQEREMKVIKQPSNPENYFSKAIGAIIAFFSSPVGKTLVWVFVFAIIGYALFKIFLSGGAGLFQKTAKEIGNDESKEEKHIDDIMTCDWEQLLKQSINASDMRLAIRYSYLVLLQLLQRKQMIHYRADKTNYDYYYEIKDTRIKSSFRQITRQYEYSWYGNYAVHDQAYQSYLSEFIELKSRLQDS